MYNFLFILYLTISFILIFCITLQDSKKTSIESVLNISSSSNFIRAQNSNNFMTKIIYIISILFFVFSLIIANVSSQKYKENNTLNVSQYKIN
ncbi:preprotein translocase subunit SecG [Sodalis-like secondary symbiont of Drepanosiphum platanoidis]|uniref:preprotein translocase subunit SecG n=1 Tax=Sodalis-like secondary symbiont of Drepanosiphum platanoidis TaxID=2994493 RepID=UPI00346481C6